MKRALITWGGWEGHEPEKVALIFRSMLEDADFHVDVSDNLECFADGDALRGLDLIVPVWTMSTIKKEWVANVSEAVARGTGLAGCHGGMCDAFRDQPLWQFMTGANWVAHPGGDGVRYRVTVTDAEHEITRGIESFDVTTEQYYLHIDPAIHVLADTGFPQVRWYHSPNGPVRVPQIWTKRWGLGRVYYNALGHKADVIASGTAHELLRRGLLWAAEGRAAALASGERYEDYAAEGKHI